MRIGLPTSQPNQHLRYVMIHYIPMSGRVIEKMAAVLAKAPPRRHQQHLRTSADVCLEDKGQLWVTKKSCAVGPTGGSIIIALFMLQPPLNQYNHCTQYNHSTQYNQYNHCTQPHFPHIISVKHLVHYSQSKHLGRGLEGGIVRCKERESCKRRTYVWGLVRGFIEGADATICLSDEGTVSVNCYTLCSTSHCLRAS